MDEGMKTKDAEGESTSTEGNVNKSPTLLPSCAQNDGSQTVGEAVLDGVDNDALSDVSSDTIPESPSGEGGVNGELEGVEKEPPGIVDLQSILSKPDEDINGIVEDTRSNIPDGVEEDEEKMPVETAPCEDKSEDVVDKDPDVTELRCTEEAINDSDTEDKTGAETSMDCSGEPAVSLEEDALTSAEIDVDKPESKQKLNVPVTTTNENGILEIISMDSSSQDESDKEFGDMDLVIQSVTGSIITDDKNGEDENSKKPHSQEKDDSDSDDENRQGMIRLRDFSTLKEKSDDEEDEDDDVIFLSPPEKNPFVKAQDLTVTETNRVMTLDMESGPGQPDSRVQKEAEKSRSKLGLARRQLSYLTQQLIARNGVITLKAPTNGIVGNTNAYPRMRASTPGSVLQQGVRTYAPQQPRPPPPRQQQPISVATANRPVPGLRPASAPTATPSGVIQIGDRLVVDSNSFTVRRNDTIVRPGPTPGTLQMSVSNVRTASELYQQQRVASVRAPGSVQPTYRVTASSVAGGVPMSISSQSVTYSRGPVLLNSAGGNFVTPVVPTGRVFSGVINHSSGNIHLQQQQQAVRLASLASVTSQIMSSGRVSRMHLSNSDAPHLSATVVNGPTTSVSPSDVGSSVQTFVLDKSTGSMIPLSSYQDLTRAVIRPNSAPVLRPRGVRPQGTLFPSPATVAAAGAQSQPKPNTAPRSSATSSARGRPRTLFSASASNPSTVSPKPAQLIQQATRLIAPQKLSNGPAPNQSKPGTTGVNSTATTTGVTAGTMKANGAPVGAPGDSGEKELNSKTFPSLVVTVKPCLQERAPKSVITASRVDLDARVKTILMYSPSKFSEWLMQQGLIRLSQKCPAHPQAACKLGMYSDGGKKHPFSGGYVWIPECCSDKQVSVFTGSIFEASVYPPGTLMKLVYHWACQTPAASVLQWVKITSYYLKNFFTLLRSACVAGLHEHAVLMGGKGKYVEIGIITLGTTVSAQGGASKQVKIEILGVFDPASKVIRMKVLNPQDEKGGGDRVSQILWPLHAWVNKQSFVLIDSSLDKLLLEGMGFTHVSQRPSNNAKISSTVPTNVNVMNYLKNIVPKMFQNTLCVLSKSLIQQFLDELSWREVWGATPSKCFDTLLVHLVEMTRAETGETLISRLNRISLNPFSEWSYTPKSSLNNFDSHEAQVAAGNIPSSTPESSTRENNSALSALDSLGELAATFMRQNKSAGAAKRKSSVLGDDISNAGSTLDGADLHRLAATGAKLYTVQSYYYAWIAAGACEGRPAFPSGLKCPMCSKLLLNNIDAMRHLMQHVVYVDRPLSAFQTVCSYCLKEISGPLMQQHIEEKHKLADMQYACRICCLKFGRENDLIVHMWTHHVEAETPYHCELCSYKSSFQFDTVDHFGQTHRDIDCVLCPMCLKTMPIKSLGDLKLIVSHLQNHLTRKSKKCQDCVLAFPEHKDLTNHILIDKAHSSQSDNPTFKRHKVLGVPIGMAKPPPVNRSDRIPPPPPPKKPKTGGSVKPGVKTLNSAISIPINPNEKFTYDRFTMRITDCSKKKCWECDADLTPTHFTGRLKCNKCRFVTSCPAAMAEHTKTHPNSSASSAPPPKSLNLPVSLRKIMKSAGPVTCSSCSSSFDFPDHLVQHMLNVCNQRSCKVSTAAVEESSAADKS